MFSTIIFTFMFMKDCGSAPIKQNNLKIVAVNYLSVSHFSCNVVVKLL